MPRNQEAKDICQQLHSAWERYGPLLKQLEFECLTTDTTTDLVLSQTTGSTLSAASCGTFSKRISRISAKPTLKTIQRRLKSLEIRHFKALADVSLDDLGSFNLLLGANDVGKTSVLEAIFLLTGSSDIELTTDIQAERQLDTGSFDVVELLFRNLNTDTSIELSCMLSDSSEKHRLNISASIGKSGVAKRIAPSLKRSRFGGESNQAPIVRSQISSSSPSQAASKILYYEAEVVGSNGKERKLSTAELEFSAREGIRHATPPNESVLIPATFVSAHARLESTAFHSVVVNKLEADLLQVLRPINPEIVSVTVSNQTAYVDIGLKKRIPLGSFGSGLVRVASVYSRALSQRAKILLIDEIENGLHHEGVANFLGAMLSIANSGNIQVFATTHRLDVLKGLQSLLQTDRFTDARSEVKCFVLAKDKNGTVIPYKYDYEQFDHCIQNGIEIR